MGVVPPVEESGAYGRKSLRWFSSIVRAVVLFPRGGREFTAPGATVNAYARDQRPGEVPNSSRQDVRFSQTAIQAEVVRLTTGSRSGDSDTLVFRVN